MKERVVEAITASIARIAEEFDSLCACCINYRVSETVMPKEAALRPTTREELFELQSEEYSPADQTSTGATQGNTGMIEESVGEYCVAHDTENPNVDVDATPDLHLGKFLERPVTIDTFSWSTSDVIGVKRTLRPWQAFLNTTSVKNKLANYPFLRGKLHVKVMINATPFQYGCLRMCYEPLVGNTASKIRTNPTSDNALRVPYSQLPGAYIWPQTNEGAQMELPFFYHKNWLDITSLANTTNMGLMSFVIFQPLALAISTAPSSITVKVVAWMEKPELMGASSKLVLQGDEYGTGPISAPATAVSNFASYLTNVPVIGKFARATQIGASAVSTIASMFGFTNVPNISNVNAFYQMSAPHLATSDISVPYQKLTLDPKSELSIDPSIFGVTNEDELSLAYLKKKESYFGDATWSTATTESTLLFAAYINPSLRNVTTLTNVTTKGYRHYDTPISYVGNVFRHWRGGIKIRIKVVASKYHKGRLRISWDPVNDISSTDPGLNEVYTQILDLGESDECTLTIPYHQALPWLSTGISASANGWGNAALSGFDTAIHNGCLAIRVFNTLEAPSSTSVGILVYISGDDDLEFANPKGYITAGDSGTPVPSFFALQSEEYYEHLGQKKQSSKDRYGQNYGEAIMSLRKLMRRSQIMDTVPMPSGVASSFNIYRKGLTRIPYTPGFNGAGAWPVSASKVLAGGTAQYAFNTMHMIPYFMGLFAGARGSVNYTVTVNSPNVRPDDIRVIRSTESGAVTAINRVIQLITNITGSSTLDTKVGKMNMIYNVRDGLGGMALTSSSVAPSVQFTLPDYNNYNFTLCDPGNYVEGSSVDGTDIQTAIISIIVSNTTATDDVGYITLSTAAGIGADFTCFYFLCCPTLDYLLGDPTPV